MRVRPKHNITYYFGPHGVLSLGVLTSPTSKLSAVDMCPDGQSGNLLIADIDEDIDFNGRTMHIQLKVTRPPVSRPRAVPRQ